MALIFKLSADSFQSGRAKARPRGVRLRPQVSSKMMDSDPSLEDVTQEETGVRLRVYPTRIQQQVLKRWIGTQRYLYNCKVEELEYQLWLKKNAKFSNRYRSSRGGLLPVGSIIFASINNSAPLDGADPQLRAPQQLQPL